MLRLLAALLLLVPLASCRTAPPPGPLPGGALRVVVSIPPLKGLVEPLLPKGSEITVLIPPGASEHGYEIPPGALASIVHADLVVYVGLGMEPQVDKALVNRPNPDQIAVQFAAAVGVSADGDDPDHKHEPGDGHDHHHAVDPHLWLDPVLTEKFAAELGKTVGLLVGKREGHAGSPATDDKTQTVVNLIRNVHDEYDRALSPGRTRHRTIIVAHDAWRRLGERYQFNTLALHGLSAAEPTPADLKAAIDAIKGEGLTTIFVEPQLSPAAAKRIADATGAKTAVLDPLGDGDWFAMMKRNLAALKAAMGEE